MGGSTCLRNSPPTWGHKAQCATWPSMIHLKKIGYLSGWIKHCSNIHMPYNLHLDCQSSCGWKWFSMPLGTRTAWEPMLSTARCHMRECSNWIPIYKISQSVGQPSTNFAKVMVNSKNGLTKPTGLDTAWFSGPQGLLAQEKACDCQMEWHFDCSMVIIQHGDVNEGGVDTWVSITPPATSN